MLRQEQDNRAEAAAAYQVAAASGQTEYAPIAAFNLGILYSEQGDGEPAQAAYRQAIDSGHADWGPTAAFNVAALLMPALAAMTRRPRPPTG